MTWGKKTFIKCIMCRKAVCVKYVIKLLNNIYVFIYV